MPKVSAIFTGLWVALRRSVSSIGRPTAHFQRDGRHRLNVYLHPVRLSSLAICAALSIFLLGAGFSPESCSWVTAFNGTTPLLPRITGADGVTQTNTASFTGNFTSFVSPAQGYFLLQRQADCSLNLITGSSTLGGTPALPGAANILTNTPHYELTLHQLASLRTTPGLFPKGCVEKNTGLSTRRGVLVGKTQQGLEVFAGVAAAGNNNAVFTIIMKSDVSGGSVASIASLTAASALTTADLNGDGNGDLVVVNSYNPASAFVSVALGNPDGSFQPPIHYPTVGSKSVAAVIDDVNGDGKLDLIVASDEQRISVLTGKGDGTFNAALSFTAAPPGGTTPIVNLITADLRGTGKKDIVGSNGLVLFGNGDGTFSASTTPAFPVIVASNAEGPNIAAGDLDNDGKLDLAVNSGTEISTWIGKGDGTFTQGKTYATINNTGFVTISDLDGDGNLDIYSGLANGGYFSGDDDSPGKAYFLMGNGDGTFSGAPTVSGTYNGRNLGDVNGDGQPDLVTVDLNSFNQNTLVFTVRLGTPKGPFKAVSTSTLPTTITFNRSTYTAASNSVSTYAVADMNGDGKADLVVLTTVNSGVGTLYFTALSNGDGTFAPFVAHALPSFAPPGYFDNAVTTFGLQAGDLNGDGKMDLVITYGEQPTTIPFTGSLYVQGFAVLLGNGDATFRTPILTTTYTGLTPSPNTFQPEELASLADLNDDGKLDMITVARNGGAATGFGSQLQTYIGKGDGTFAAPVIIPTATNPRVPDTTAPAAPFTLADFNKDGKLDLACLGETASGQGQLTVSLGRGDGTFNAPNTLNLAGGDTVKSAGLAAADFDADGTIDLALLNAYGVGGIFYGKSDGTFSSVVNGNNFPKDIFNLFAGGATLAVDLNKDGRPDLLSGKTLLLNIYGSAPNTTVPSATTTALNASTLASTVGSNITFTATIASTAGSTGTPSGNVTFLDGTANLGSAVIASGKATLTTAALMTGTHNITAVYAGDAVFATSTSFNLMIIVSVVPVVVATSTGLSASATTAVSGTTITFTSTISPIASTTVPAGTVTLMDGTTSLGTATLDLGGRATFAISTLAVGTHSLTASYSGTAGASTTFSASVSPALSVTIAALAAPDFTVALSSSSATIARGSTATSTLTLTPMGGYKQASTLNCSGAQSGTTCTLTPSTLAPDGTNAATATLTLQTSATGSFPAALTNIFYVLTLPFGFMVVASAKGRRIGLRRMLLASVLLMTGAGCGHKSASIAPTTSTITVTASGGSTTHATTFTLTVQ